ncbi:MAS20 protein import receptor-domain-containing protein [Phlyctochytrium arcticum]|nr:MAS20 protein import receptor-domain-containing protein [Phlyctochytrium arcticum]
MVTTREVVVGTAAAAAVLGVGYLIYFDQKRHRDPIFRRKLNQQRREALRMKEANAAEARLRQRAAAAAAPPAAAPGGFDLDEPVPENPQERGEYFMKHLQMGEALCSRGPQAYELAAKCFFKALQAYNEPMNLLMVLQQSVPEPVMSQLMELYAADLYLCLTITFTLYHFLHIHLQYTHQLKSSSARQQLKKHQQEYFQTFPTPDKNVRVKQSLQNTTSEGKRIIRRGLEVTKAFKAGDIIYEEQPIALTRNLKIDVNVCDHCMKDLSAVEDGISCDQCKSAHYCSDACSKLASKEYHTFLCAGDQETGDAVRKLEEHCREIKSRHPYLVAVFLSKMVYEETLKPQEEGAAKPKYSTWDHLERLYDLKLKTSDTIKKEIELIVNIISPKVPGFAEFLTEERYLMIKGKFGYNVYAVSTCTADSVEDYADPVRTSTAASEHSGLALYHITSLISHACSPNVKITHPNATGDAALVAMADLDDGEEIFISYIATEEKELKERRKELKRKYNFHCKCSKCAPVDS